MSENDGPSNSYNIIYFFLTYMVPIVAMGICYGRIGSVLWGRKKGIIRENAANDLAQVLNSTTELLYFIAPV